VENQLEVTQRKTQRVLVDELPETSQQIYRQQIVVAAVQG
jgi:hypothetical protein